jgi:2-polyprenyl-3-methyl-5-hydroxy-6-metoxy-1,4-benzoquinol methylase
MTTIQEEQHVDPGAAPDSIEEAVGALAGRIFEAGLGAFELLSVYVGKELGLYDALVSQGTVTPGTLAAHAEIDARYAREWLEQQTIAGFVEVDDPQAGPEERTYRLSPATAAVLVDETSLAYLAPFATFVVAIGDVIPKVLEAYRHGGGVSFGGFGDLVREAQAALNRPAFENLLPGWISAGFPDVHERLTTGEATRVADIGCGCGWSTIALAKAYPKARVDGLDSDQPSIKTARRNAANADRDNVRFEARDAADPALAGKYDLVCVFEALHDMAQPVAALTAARDLLAPGGSVLVMDERVADEFGAVGDPIERFMYACSVVHCLPVGMSEHPSSATGTVLRTSTLKRYAAEAGLSVTVLPLEHDCWRFYRLDQV